MSYRLQNRQPVAEEIKRIAEEQVDQALEQLTQMPEGRNEAVHDARKRFKKIRAVLRLVRDDIGHDVYRAENVCFRDAGRQLADVRDSWVMVETVDDLTDRFEDQLDPEAFADVRARLLEAHEATVHDILDKEGAIEEVTDTIQAARARIAAWPISNEGFATFDEGLHRVYKRGWKRMADAYDDPQPERFHEWRKRVKYLWYHTRILKPVWPDLLDELADQVHDLSDYLGDAHDLAELRHLLDRRPDLTDDIPQRQALVGLIDRRMTQLETAARPLGERLYAEKPKYFIGRIKTYWEAWQMEPDLGLGRG